MKNLSGESEDVNIPNIYDKLPKGDARKNPFFDSTTSNLFRFSINPINGPRTA